MAAKDPDGRCGRTPVWAKEKPRRRPALSRDAIVEAAMKIADAEGLDAVSIRRVAGDLGVRPMSLYTYIDRKEDLFDLMRDRANSAILFGDELPRGWRDALTSIARRTREVMLRHRWMANLDVHNAAAGPNALRHVEESIGAIAELGLSPLATIEVLTAVDKFVVGHVIFELADHTGLAEQAYIQALLASGEFPRLNQVVTAARTAAATSDEFERGLTWLLDGIEAQFRK